MFIPQSLAHFSRPTLKSTIVGVTGVILVASAYLTYAHNNGSNASKSPDSGLHRSGAVRHRRARAQTLENADVPLTELLETRNDPDGAPPAPVSDNDAEQVAQNNGQASELNQLAFEIAAKRESNEGIVHRGIHCNGCSRLPIRGVRYRCANCSDFDFCETCEATQDHPKTHVFYKLKVPRYWAAPMSTLPWYPGRPKEMPPELPEPVAASLRNWMISNCQPEHALTDHELQGLYVQFTCFADERMPSRTSGVAWGISRRALRYFLPVTKRGALVFERLFLAFDNRREGLISFESFVEGVLLIRLRENYPRWKQRVFRMVDINDTGLTCRQHFIDLYKSLRQIEEDITLYHLHSENITEDVDLIEGDRTATDAIEGYEPLPNYFAMHAQLHMNRLGPQFGTPDPDPLSSPNDNATGIHLDGAREQPPSTASSRHIEAIQQAQINHMLDPIFGPLDGWAHRVAISRNFQHDYQREIELFRAFKTNAWEHCIAQLAAPPPEELLKHQARWIAMAATLDVPVSHYERGFMHLLETVHPDPPWWDRFAARAHALVAAYVAHTITHFDALLARARDATLDVRQRHDRRGVRPDLVFWLFDEMMWHDAATRGGQWDEARLSSLNYAQFWERVDAPERHQPDGASATRYIFNMLNLVVV